MLGFHAVSEAPLSRVGAIIGGSVSISGDATLTAQFAKILGVANIGRSQTIIPRGGLSRGRKPELPILNLAHPLSHGLVNALAFYEGAGSTVYDLSPYGANNTITHYDFAGGTLSPGEPVWQVRGERCLKLNNEQATPHSATPHDVDTLDVETDKLSSVFNGSNSWSLVWWQNLDDSENTSGRSGCIFNCGTSITSFKSVYVFINGGKIDIDYYGRSDIFSDASLSFGNLNGGYGAWQQIAITYDGSTIKVYVDGKQKGSASVSLDLDVSKLRWGNEIDGNQPTFMLMKSALIYERTLLGSEIQELETNPYGIYRASTPLIPDLTTTAVATVDLAGHGTLAAASSLSGAATLTTNGLLKLSARVSISSTGSLTVRAAPMGSAIVTGPATVITNGSLSLAGRTSLSGVATLSSNGSLKLRGQQTVSGTATVSSNGYLSLAGVLSVSSSGSVSLPNAYLTLAGAQTISGSATFGVAGDQVAPGAASISGVATLTAAAVRVPTGIGILTGLSTVEVKGSMQIDGELSATSTATLSADGYSSVQAATSITAQGTVSIVSFLRMSGVLSVSGSGSVGSAGKMKLKGVIPLAPGGFDHSFNTAFITAPSFSVTGRLTQAFAISLSSAATLTVEEAIKLKAVIILTGPSSVVTNGEILKTGVVSTSSVGTLSSAPRLIHTSIISLANQGSLSLNGVLSLAGATNWVSSAILGVKGSLSLSGPIGIIGSVTFTPVQDVLIPDKVLITLYIDQIYNVDRFIYQNKTTSSYIKQQLTTNLSVDLESSLSRYIDREFSIPVER
jgi:hypothetical protein